MKLAIVLVHYHAADLAVAAHQALAADLDVGGLEAEWLLVDNGSRPDEKKTLASLPVRVIDAGRNLGYAAGANLGVRQSTAEFICLMNPDVLVLSGCTEALCQVLQGGAAAAGPRFYWDRNRSFLLPPTEKRTRRDELLRLLAERGKTWARLGRRRWRRHAWRCWNAREPFRCHELSGALLAFRRRAWEDLGGFDEGYRLYFEETDWLERLRARGHEAWFVPRAEAVHLYAQSTVGEPRAERWFVESHRRFRRRFYGAAFTAGLERLSRIWRPTAPRTSLETSRDGQAAWLEVSSSPVGYPAAGRLLEGTSDPRPGLPEDVCQRLPPGTYHLRTVDRKGRELGLRQVSGEPRRGGHPHRGAPTDAGPPV